MNDQQLLRYSRHILLDEIGIEGQQRLLEASALVVGAGGLGCPASMFLASAGVGQLVIADDDRVDLTNLQRQIAHTTARVGAPKVDSLAAALEALNPETRVTALRERLSGERLAELVRASSVVLDCSDNFATRHAVNRACVLEGRPLVSGAAIRFDAQLGVFDPRDRRSPCYACVFPATDTVDDVRCATMGVFAPLVGIVGSLQAAEALKLLAGVGEGLAGRLLMLDARDMSWQALHVHRDPACAVCGN
jgi:molybdopterin/thiamine biosynthesis adenylyltransferase